MRADTITRQIQCSFTPAVKEEIARQMAIEQADMETAEGEKKVSDAAYNERIKKHSAEVSALAKRYNQGYEVKEVDCDIRYNHPAPGQKSLFRTDTAELVETVDMTWEEKQEEIQFNLTDKSSCEHPIVSGQAGEWRCDACGAVLSEKPAPPPTAEDVNAALDRLTTEIPPKPEDPCEPQDGKSAGANA